MSEGNVGGQQGSLSPDLSGEELAALADSRPELWDEISVHPNIYPELLAWIAAGRAEAAGDDVAVTPTQPALNDLPPMPLPPTDFLPPAPPAESAEPTAYLPPAPPASATPQAPFVTSAPASIPAATPPAPATEALPDFLTPPSFNASQPPAAAFGVPTAGGGETGEVPPAAWSGMAAAEAGGGKRKGLLATLIAVAVVVLLAGGYVGVAAWQSLWPFAADTAASEPQKDAKDTAETADSTKEKDAADAKAAAEKRLAALSVPQGFAECPADTVVLGWGEIDTKVPGWLLVCGVDDAEPTYVAFQKPESSRAIYSLGSKDATSADAKAAVNWNDRKQQFTAEISDSTGLIADYDTGTVILEDTAKDKGQTFALDRFVFAPASEKVRTAQDTQSSRNKSQSTAQQDDADAQVAAVSALLTESASVRSEIKSVLTDDACRLPTSAMESIRDRRAALLNQTNALKVDAIPEGAALLADLQAAANANYQVAVERAGRSASGNCSPSGAETANISASDAAKERIAERWNRAVVPQFSGANSIVAWDI